jgi:hypothetical protein
MHPKPHPPASSQQDREGPRRPMPAKLRETLMKILLAPALIALALAATAASAETRNLSGFRSVAARDGVDVYVTQGEGFRVDVSGRDAERVRTEVRDHTLQISRRNLNWFGFNRDLSATVRVTMPVVEDLSAARGASLRATDLRAGDLDLSAAMGADIEVSGTCRALSASAAMGASLDASALVCSDADASAAMGADVNVNATNAFEASASMGASISNSGNATHQDISSSMGGSVSN